MPTSIRTKHKRSQNNKTKPINKEPVSDNGKLPNWTKVLAGGLALVAIVVVFAGSSSVRQITINGSNPEYSSAAAECKPNLRDDNYSYKVSATCSNTLEIDYLPADAGVEVFFQKHSYGDSKFEQVEDVEIVGPGKLILPKEVYVEKADGYKESYEVKVKLRSSNNKETILEKVFTVTTELPDDQLPLITERNSMLAEQQRKDEAEAAKEEAVKLKNARRNVAYDDLFRNSSEYLGDYFEYTGEIFQDVSDNVSSDKGYFVQITKKVIGSSEFYDDTVLLQVDSKFYDTKLLEDDVVKFIARGSGTYTYETVQGASKEIPELTAVSEVEFVKHND